MWLYNVFILCAILGVQGKRVKHVSEEAELKWPETYSFEALRIYLLAGFTEDYQMWRTPNKSRVDNNDGAVKSIVDKSTKFGKQYKIHPEADENGDSSYVCEEIKGKMFRKLSLENILPETDGFEKVAGKELIDDLETSKFVYDETSESVQLKKTLWAVYSSDAKAWLPKKYQVEEFNIWIGSATTFEIWEFKNVETEVKDEYFDVEEVCNNATVVSKKDDLVTRDLLFMDPDNDNHVDHVFKSFKKTYNKKYGDDSEHEMRRSIFQHNMRLVSMINRQNLGYKLAINKFADRAPSEKVQYTGLLRRQPDEKGNIKFPYTEGEVKEIAETLPAEYDTRLYGLVGTVKNQETCGSCWTFGTTVSLEGAVARSNGGKFVTLSNQAILDCAWPYGGSGCNGGSDTAAYNWLMNNGIPSQAEYGDYADQDGFCRIKEMKKLYKIKGFVDVAPNSVDAIKVALVNHGPLSVSVNVDEVFQAYAGGIFYEKGCDPTALNHEVALVGYGESEGDTYWILKNSWGTEWGVDGYMHISARDNVCGVATEPSFVVMA